MTKSLIMLNLNKTLVYLLLGLMISEINDQCIAAKKKVNKMLVFISRKFDLILPEVMKRFCSICDTTPKIHDSIHRKDQNLLERLQRRATKHIPTLHYLLYKEHLEQLDMFPLHKQRIIRDMIEVFQILNKFDRIHPEILMIY